MAFVVSSYQHMSTCARFQTVWDDFKVFTYRGGCSWHFSNDANFHQEGTASNWFSAQWSKLITMHAETALCNLHKGKY